MTSLAPENHEFALVGSASTCTARRKRYTRPVPTVDREGPYRFFFYSADRDEPPHVHVERDANGQYSGLRRCGWLAAAVSARTNCCRSKGW